ncbi:MAG: hypothetical protein AVDCRST_MAG85-745, partial [uncultured Solirubrobacteraceae bacterium]
CRGVATGSHPTEACRSGWRSRCSSRRCSSSRSWAGSSRWRSPWRRA